MLAFPKSASLARVSAGPESTVQTALVPNANATAQGSLIEILLLADALALSMAHLPISKIAPPEVN